MSANQNIYDQLNEMRQQSINAFSNIRDLENKICSIMENFLLNQKEEKKEKWKWPVPKANLYWFIGAGGLVVQDTWLGIDYDKSRYSNFNVFRSKEEAEEFKHLGTYQRKWAMILKELNPEGYKPDWKNYSQHKYRVYYNHEDGGFEILDNTVNQERHSIMYASTRYICEKAIELMGDDIWKMFGIEKPV